jgi:hypothetical protein
LQQPFAHDVASQTHLPPTQSRPLAQPAHLTPPVPHAVVVVAVTQCWLMSQQPLGHVVASQTHWPCGLHSWSAAHAWQDVPLRPQVALDDALQEPPAVQHPAQAPPPHVHLPFEQACPLPQGPHTAPAVPHEVGDCAV